MATDEEVIAHGGVGNKVQLKESLVSDEAKVYGNVKLYNSIVRSAAQVYGNAEVRGSKKGMPAGAVIVAGDCHIFGNAKIVNNIKEGHFAIILYGNCKFGGNATFEEILAPEDFIEKYGAAKVKIHFEDIETDMIMKSTVILTDVWDMG